jgi:hypothetical protein
MVEHDILDYGVVPLPANKSTGYMIDYLLYDVQTQVSSEWNHFIINE